MKRTLCFLALNFYLGFCFYLNQAFAQMPGPPIIDTPLTTSKTYFYNGEIMVPYSNGHVSVTNNAAVNVLSTTEVTLLPGFTASVDSGCYEFVAGIQACPILSINPSIANISCYGGTNGQIKVDVTGGSPPYQFSWSPRNGGSLLVDLSIGNYYLTVTDNSGCNVRDSFTISQPTPISATITVTPSECHHSNGSAEITASGGTGDLIYHWDRNSETNSSLYDLSAGIYEILISDQLGCLKKFFANISDLDGPSVTTSILSDISCAGKNDARFVINHSIGDPEPVYPCGYNEEGMGAGYYPIIQQDLNGCTTVAEVYINEPEPLTLQVLSTPSNCGQSTGSATVSVVGGTGSYTYYWSTGEITPTINSLKSGVDTITVTDENGCIVSQPVYIVDTNSFTLSATVKNTSCAFKNDGSIILSVIGGVPPYHFKWDQNDIVSDSAYNLYAGKYSTFVIDSIECSNFITTFIQEPEELKIYIESTTPSSIANVDGTLQVNVFGGTIPYTYSWSNNETTAQIQNLIPGTYNLTVTDAASCRVSSNPPLDPYHPPGSPWTQNTPYEYSQLNSSNCVNPAPHAPVLWLTSNFCADGQDNLSDEASFELANYYINNNYAPNESVTLKIPAGTYYVGRQSPGYEFYLKGHHILDFNNRSNVTIEGELNSDGSPATFIEYEDCMYYGAFDPVSGLRFVHSICCKYTDPTSYYNCTIIPNPDPLQPNLEDCNHSPKPECICRAFGTWQEYEYGATLGDFINLDNCSNIFIKNLSVNGNIDHMTIGGHFSSVGDGIQLPHKGISLKSCSHIYIQDVNMHHFGSDGINIVDFRDHNTPVIMDVNILRSKFNWNCRSGMSWDSGTLLHADQCEFNYNGYGPWGGSATRDGLDIEFQSDPTLGGNFYQDLASGYFKNCEFKYNGASGIQSDVFGYRTPSGTYPADLSTHDFFFDNCTVVSGAGGYSAWPCARNFNFKCCTFVGPLIHGYGAPITSQSGPNEFNIKFQQCSFFEEYIADDGIKYAFTNTIQNSCSDLTFNPRGFLISFETAGGAILNCARASFNYCFFNTNYYNKWGRFVGVHSTTKENYVSILNSTFYNTGLEERCNTSNCGAGENTRLMELFAVDLGYNNRVYLAHASSNCSCSYNQWLYCYHILGCNTNRYVDGHVKMPMGNNGVGWCGSGCSSNFSNDLIPDGYTDVSYTGVHPCSPKFPRPYNPSINIFGTNCDPNNQPGGCYNLEPLACSTSNPNQRKKINSFNSALIVSPNPCFDFIQVNNFNSGKKMIISDLYGKVIYERISDAESFKLDIKFLPAGVYFISIDGRYSKKIIKL